MQESYREMATVYDRLMQDVPYDRWVDFLSLLWQRLGIVPPRTCADVACGTGSVSIELASRGLSVIGVDLSEDMLRVAWDRSRRAGRKIAFVRQDMRALRLHKCVDVVTCCCDGVNYLLDTEDLDAFLASAAAALNNGGALVFDVSTAHKFSRVLDGKTYGEDLKDLAYLWQNTYDRTSRRVRMDLSFFVRQGGGAYRRFTETHTQRAWQLRELRSALEKAGFANIQFFDGYTARPAAARSERIVCAAVKIGF